MSGAEAEPEIALHELHAQLQNETRDALAQQSDPRHTHCTFELGYVRQSLFACLQCREKNADEDRCHRGHRISELWSKRAVKCDCGTERCPVTCKFPAPNNEDKALVRNERNVYGQNFAGTFCFCGDFCDNDCDSDDDSDAEEDEEDAEDSRDGAGSKGAVHVKASDAGAEDATVNAEGESDDDAAEPDTSETMLQCVVCEDWFHVSCLRERAASLPQAMVRADQALPIVCCACVAAHPAVVELAAYVCKAPLKPRGVHGPAFPSRARREREKKAKAAAAAAAAATASSSAASAVPAAATGAQHPLLKDTDVAAGEELSHVILHADYQARLQQAVGQAIGQRDPVLLELLSASTEDYEVPLRWRDDPATLPRSISNSPQATAEARFLAGLPHVKQIAVARGLEHLRRRFAALVREAQEAGRVITREDVERHFDLTPASGSKRVKS